MEIKRIIESLENSPKILAEMLSKIPPKRLAERRIKGKWNIHEHAVHISRTQPMLNVRLERFMKEKSPAFVPYDPSKTKTPDELMKVDLKQALKDFAKERKRFIAMLKKLKPADWRNKARHPEYDEYTPYIMARHVLLHDNVHMYRIEELWLTKKL